MRKTKSKSPSSPADFGEKTNAYDEIFRSLTPVRAAIDFVSAPPPTRQFRRGPFYLKIEGLTGPRPKYDGFGRLMPPEEHG